MALTNSGLDDILNYVGPSLEEHKGCDIIDIHPGACLWSQKLHDFLKPRRHLLMEPEEKYLKPFIQPLLDKPGSAYRHTTLSGAHPKDYFESYERIFNDESLLPKRKPLAPGDPQLRQNNKTLLVTGTVSRRYRSIRNRINNVHNANLLLNHMVQSSQTNGLFHAYGLVRMLFWHPEDTKAAVLPDVVSTRGSYATCLEVAADMVEVAGRDRSLTMSDRDTKYKLLHRFRFPEIEQMGADQVLEKMESTGMHMPAHRRNTNHQAALDRKESMTQSDREAEGRRIVPIYLPENVSLEDAVALHDKETKEYVSAFLTKKGGSSEQIPYKYQFGEATAKLLSDNQRSRVGPYMDLWGRQLALEAAIIARKRQSTEADLGEMEAEVRRLAVELHNAINHKELMPAAKRTMVHTMQSEMQAYKGKLLAYDRRPYEALALKRDEFWPQFNMFLVDVQPRSMSPANGLATPVEANAVLRSLVQTLWQLSASSVPLAVERVASNAAHDLLPDVPDLTDAAKGGRLDAEEMQVRMLTREMVEQLTGAYLEWPFRPSSTEMADVQ